MGEGREKWLLEYSCGSVLVVLSVVPDRYLEERALSSAGIDRMLASLGLPATAELPGKVAELESTLAAKEALEAEHSAALDALQAQLNTAVEEQQSATALLQTTTTQKDDELADSSTQLAAVEAELASVAQALQASERQLISVKEAVSGEATFTAEVQDRLIEAEEKLAQEIAEIEAAQQEHTRVLLAMQTDWEAVFDRAQVMETALVNKEGPETAVSARVVELAQVVQVELAEMASADGEKQAELEGAQTPFGDAPSKVTELKTALAEMTSADGEKQATMAGMEALKIVVICVFIYIYAL